jgi:hypothetical protein
VNAAVWVAAGGAVSSVVAAVLALRKAAALRTSPVYSPSDKTEPSDRVVPLSTRSSAITGDSDLEADALLRSLEARLRPTDPLELLDFEELLERLGVDGFD